MGRLEHFESKEKREIDKLLIKPENFTVKVRNLPIIGKYKSAMELKAMLWNHMESVVKKAP